MSSPSPLAAPDPARAAAPALAHVAELAGAAAARTRRATRAAASSATTLPAALRATGMMRVLQAGLALFFLFAGADALADAPAIGADFELLTDLTGAGAWLRLTAGGVEVLGAALLVLPAERAAAVGTLLLGALMAVTAVAYVVVLHAAPLLPAVLLALTAGVAYARRDALAEVGDFLVRNL